MYLVKQGDNMKKKNTPMQFRQDDKKNENGLKEKILSKPVAEYGDLYPDYGDSEPTATLGKSVDTTPGFKTSEFWITQASIIIPSIITILTLWKIVPTEISSTLTAALTALVSGIITVVVALRYIKSRTAVKIRALDDKINRMDRAFNEDKNRMDRAFNTDVQNTNDYYQKANLYLQLKGRGIITDAQLKKELNIK